jgi:type I restriction enzyme S subunit
MELKPGYKQTEVGVIPEDWDMKRLGEVARFRTGPFGSALHKEDYTDNGIPIVNPMHIVDAAIVPTHEMSITAHRATELADFRLRQGDIVIGRRGEMGRCAVVAADQDGWLCGTGSMIARANQGYSAEFLQLLLSSKPVIASIENASVGSTMINLNQGVLNGLKLALPSNKEEQQAIATSIKAVGSQVEALQALITKKRQLKQAAMQELLTGKRRLPGFEGEWEVKRLGDIAVLNRNNIVPALYPDKLFTHYSLPAFDADKAALVEAGASIGSNKFTVPASAVLVSKLNPRIPRAWAPEVVPPNAVASTEWLILTPKDGIDRNYLFALCCSPAFCEQMELAATGTTGSHQRISPSIALDIKINTTPLRDEQVAISLLLSDMDSELSILYERLQKARELKQGMMQQLLTGKIRLQ